MSLIVAVTNGREIVIGADSLAYEGSVEVYRTYEIPKLRLVNGGKWVIAFTGLGQVARTVWDCIDARGETFNPDIRISVLECIKCMGEIYTEYRLNSDAKAILAGFCGHEPYIYSWGIAQPSPKGGDIPSWAAIGCGSDVALHYVRNCRPIVDFDTEKLSALLYFSISEIAKSDVRVGKPIDIAVVKESGATLKRRESIQHLEPLSEHLGSLIRNEILRG